MVNTKKEISKQAKKLFNEKGYRNVSLREIAEAAGTTIGNLTYHYRQKEDLVLSLQDDLYSNFLTEQIDQIKIQKDEDLLEKIILSFSKTKQNRNDNHFFYRNIIELSQESAVIAKNMEEFQVKLYQFYFSSFIQLRECQIMRSDIDEHQYEILAYTIVYMSYLWIQDTTLYYDKSIPKIEINDGLKNIIYPYLTQKGMNAYAKIIVNELI